MSPQADYDARIRNEVWHAYQQMLSMQHKLLDEREAAKLAGNTPRVLQIGKALATSTNGASPKRLLANLDQIYRESGKWKPSPQRPLEDRAATAGEVLKAVGQLGRAWRELLLHFGVPIVPDNPLYHE